MKLFEVAIQPMLFILGFYIIVTFVQTQTALNSSMHFLWGNFRSRINTNYLMPSCVPHHLFLTVSIEVAQPS